MQIIASPAPGLPEFHLIAAARTPVAESLMYVPFSDAPALSRDMLRVDRLPRSHKPLAAILQDWLTRYAQLFNVSGLLYRAELTTESEFLVSAGFTEHPFVGAHNTQLRYLRRDDADYSMEFIRRLDPLPMEDVAGRFAFLCNWNPFAPSYGAWTANFTPFAAAANTQSEWNTALMVDPQSRSRLMSIPLRELGKALVKASPFHNAEMWANLARFYGRSVVDNGLIDDFDRAAACLKTAVLILHDARAEPFLHRLLFDVAENLADLLMYIDGAARAEQVTRAVQLYRTLTSVWTQADPKRAMNADVMAAFGSVVLEPDSLMPFAARLSPPGRAALLMQDRALETFDFLIGYANRLAYIARRKGRLLFSDACLAADIAQVVAEQIYVAGGEFNERVGLIVQAFQIQLDSQLGLWGLTQQDLDRTAKAFRARFRRSEEEMPRLLFLRPLATSRRIRLENRLGPYYDDVRSPLLPETLTLESALHNAFLKHFNTEALGGPIDLFGMARATALGAFDSGMESWQSAISLSMQHAQIVIAVFDEREALYWEMSELARLRAFGKLIFVMPPVAGGKGDAGYSPGAVSRLQDLGLKLPEAVPASGFMLFEESGKVEKNLPFDSLWSGELPESIRKRKPVRRSSMDTKLETAGTRVCFRPFHSIQWLDKR